MQESVERRQRLATQEQRDAGTILRDNHLDVTRRQDTQQQQQRTDDVV